jgi:hypothetical protein
MSNNSTLNEFRPLSGPALIRGTLARSKTTAAAAATARGTRCRQTHREMDLLSTWRVGTYKSDLMQYYYLLTTGIWPQIKLVLFHHNKNISNTRNSSGQYCTTYSDNFMIYAEAIGIDLLPTYRKDNPSDIALSCVVGAPSAICQNSTLQ